MACNLEYFNVLWNAKLKSIMRGRIYNKIFIFPSMSTEILEDCWKICKTFNLFRCWSTLAVNYIDKRNQKQKRTWHSNLNLKGKYKFLQITNFIAMWLRLWPLTLPNNIIRIRYSFFGRQSKRVLSNSACEMSGLITNPERLAHYYFFLQFYNWICGEGWVNFSTTKWKGDHDQLSDNNSSLLFVRQRNGIFNNKKMILFSFDAIGVNVTYIVISK